MKKILIGTTNPSKIKKYQDYLSDFDIEWYTLKDLGIETIPEETGLTPKENAEIKARYYGQFFDSVICNDSGLYFLDFPLDAPIQPGLYIRRVEGKELSDEEMIAYYSQLAHQHGGKILASYIQGVAVYEQGELSSFVEYDEFNRYYAFYLNDHIVDTYTPGWPLDALYSSTGFFDEEETNLKKQDYDQRFRRFLVDSLKLK